MTLLGVVPLPIYSIAYACSGQVIYIKAAKTPPQSINAPSGTIIATRLVIEVTTLTVAEP